MRISVITVCRNAEKTIADTIQSVRAQDYTDYEHIIVDGASTDATLDIVRHLGHDKLKVVSEKDRGLYDAMNKGIALAGGDLIGFLNSDDFFCRTDALGLIATTALNNSQAAAVSAGLIYIDPNQPSRVRRTYGAVGFRRWMLRVGHMPPHPGFYARAAAFKVVGPFEIERRIGGDFEWMVRFFYVHGLTAIPFAESIVAMRMGGLSTSGWKSMRTINTEARQALRTHRIWTTAALIWSKYLLKAGQLMTTKASFRVPEPVRWRPG
jgi:glycosyltransferase involved in cell wall biosynthesis